MVLEIKIRLKDVIQLVLLIFFTFLFLMPAFLLIYKILGLTTHCDLIAIIIMCSSFGIGTFFMYLLGKTWNSQSQFRFKKIVLNEDGKIAFISKDGQKYPFDIYTDVYMVYSNINEYEIAFEKGKNSFSINSRNIKEKELFEDFFKRFMKVPISDTTWYRKR